jgi:hypothetical protein
MAQRKRLRRRRSKPHHYEHIDHSFYNPRFSLRQALIEKKVLWPKLHPNPEETKEFTKEDLKELRTIDLDKLEELVKIYGKEGSKKYSEEKLRHFRLFGLFELNRKRNKRSRKIRKRI